MKIKEDVLKEALEIIEKVSNDSLAEVKIRLQAQVFLKRNQELLRRKEDEQ